MLPLAQGVPESGKTVPSREWWLPHPATGRADRLTYTHAAALEVLHAPGDPVTRACKLSTCPWPKQLFLRDHIEVDLTESASWDLFRYPFDTQLIRTMLHVLDQREFSTKAAYANAAVVANLSTFLPNSSSGFADIYQPDDWQVVSAVAEEVVRRRQRKIRITMRIKRASTSIIYKCFVPTGANSALVMVS
jgi:hypothetical protein